MRTAVVILAVSLASCAPYWIKVGPAQPVLSVTQSIAPCGHPTWGGCTQRTSSGAHIEIKQGLDDATYSCILAHELKHAQGYDHDLRWNLHRHNCGDF